jgi:hypothetical protein
MIRERTCSLCEALVTDDAPDCTRGARFVDAQGVEHARWAWLTEPGSIDWPDLPCPTCGVEPFGYHHDPCEVDMCPHGQWIDCKAGCRLLLPGELAYEREHVS